MSKLAERYGPWAVVTGASAGIGAEFALRIAELGINVVLVARRRNRLEELASTIEDMYRVQARVAPVDLASRDVIQVLQPVLADIDVGLLVNCAGYGSSGPFLDMDPSVQEAMINVNCRASILLTHEIVQGMRERGRGGVIFVSSVNGFCASRGMANYNATKAYDLLFAEGLAGGAQALWRRRAGALSRGHPHRISAGGRPRRAQLRPARASDVRNPRVGCPDELESPRWPRDGHSRVPQQVGGPDDEAHATACVHLALRLHGGPVRRG